jgi:hypothetical protein
MNSQLFFGFNISSQFVSDLNPKGVLLKELHTLSYLLKREAKGFLKLVTIITMFAQKYQ